MPEPGSSEKGASGIRRERVAGVVDISVANMTRNRWASLNRTDQDEWLAAHRLNRGLFEAGLARGDTTSDMSGTGDYGGGGGGGSSGSGDEEFDPTVMTRERWDSMNATERRAYLNQMGRNAAERERLIAQAAQHGFDGIVQVLRGRRDVEVAEINANRDIQIARIRAGASAESALVSGSGSSSSSSAPAAASKGPDLMTFLPLLLLLVR